MINIFRIFFILIFFTTNLFGNSEKDLYKKIDLFGEVLQKVTKEYVDEVDESKMIDSAINGALQSLDAYSAYMSPEVFKSMETDTKGEFGGLGIEVGMEAGVIKVISPIDDTPASKAGIKAGDYIIKIDGEQVQGKTLMEAVRLMRGTVGSKIKLTIRRKGERKALEKTIKREVIQITSVESKIIEKNIGYLRLKSFNSNSSKQLLEKINKLENKNKPIGYILDLRNNPGGLLTQAINVTDFFLEQGEIVSTKGRRAIESRLKDHKRAIILGEETYGKGSVQSIIPLSDGGGIRLTVSKYYLPSGDSISEVGVKPDILVEEDEKKFELNSSSDNQLNYAIRLLTI